MVELDISKGLLPEIDLLYGDPVITQRLDYLHMPFRCNYSHETGHLRNSCTLLRRGRSVKHGFDLSSRSVSPSPEVSIPSVEPLEPTSEVIYASSSPTPYEGLSKGELKFIEDIEVCACLSHTLDSDNP